MQPNDWRSGSDAGLEKLFAAAYRETPPEPFTATVMRPVRRSARRRWLRAWVIGSALAVGVALAADPLVGLLARAGSAAIAVRGGVTGALGADVVAMTEMYRIPVLAVLLCAFAWPALARWIAR